jgi:hypothetical protein
MLQTYISGIQYHHHFHFQAFLNQIKYRDSINHFLYSQSGIQLLILEGYISKEFILG